MGFEPRSARHQSSSQLKTAQVISGEMVTSRGGIRSLAGKWPVQLGSLGKDSGSQAWLKTLGQGLLQTWESLGSSYPKVCPHVDQPSMEIEPDLQAASAQRS